MSSDVHNVLDPREKPFIPSIFNLETVEMIKENRRRWPAVATGWLWAAVVASAAALALAVWLDGRLPAPRRRDRAAPDQFLADNAMEHLRNLTALGPRVAGSYENEVLAVSVLVEAARRVRSSATPHHRLDIDVQRAAGAFPIAFLDGLNNVYRGVQSVVVRVSAAGGPGPGPGPRPGAGRGPGAGRALLLNCHYDTVPDSPGASDDAAGCAVLLEVMRAITSRRAPLTHDVIFLFNGAEENIMQASHGFITQHKWARSVRAFINMEACGAGGREVLFQSGPRDPWLMEVYSAEVPYPFASSLAQEIFESGAVPGDTDFRIFRDFANLSGVDLAWSANGYVYHTALDTERAVPAGSLQRAGDNVLALALGVLSAPQMAGGEGAGAGTRTVYFDVVGALAVCVRAPAAAAVALLLLALLPLRLRGEAAAAGRALAEGAAAAGGGAAAAALVGGVLHVTRRRMLWYSEPLLLAPLFGVPAVVTSWWVCWRAGAARGAAGGGAGGARGGRAARAAAAAAWGAALALCAARGLRAGYLPALHLAAALTDLLPALLHGEEWQRWWCWALANFVPMLQTWSLSVSSLAMFVPIAGRAGDMMPDVVVGVATAVMSLAACSWMTPLVLVTHRPERVMKPLALGSACLALGALLLGAPYSDTRPQRLMLFHARLTHHALAAPAPAAPAPAVRYWAPVLDANTRATLHQFAGDDLEVMEMSEAECERMVYCGAPYYLPAQSLLPHAVWLVPRVFSEPPLVRLHANVTLTDHHNDTATVHLDIEGPSHVTVAVRGRLLGTSLGARLQGGRWRGEDVHFFLLHDAAAAAAPARWSLALRVARRGRGAGEAWGALAVAGHALHGAAQRAAQHRALLRRLPPHVTHTGWGIDVHHYTL